MSRVYQCDNTTCKAIAGEGSSLLHWRNVGSMSSDPSDEIGHLHFCSDHCLAVTMAGKLGYLNEHGEVEDAKRNGTEEHRTG